MKKIFYNLSVILLFGLALITIYVLLFTADKKYGNGQTETNLPLIVYGKKYDFVFLGSSHARIFSRFDSHKKVEDSLHKTFINLSQGGNKESLKNQMTYLRYFYQRGNTNKLTVYFLDPFIFYRKELLSRPDVFDNEPFRLDFLYTLLTRGDYNWETISSYVLAVNHGKVQAPTQIKQGTVSAQLISTRMKNLYLDPIDTKDLQYLTEIGELSQNHGVKVIVIIPPTLFPRHKQAEVVKKELIKLQKTARFTLYDFSEVMKNPKYFSDTDHLNGVGIQHFIQRYFRPILATQN